MATHFHLLATCRLLPAAGSGDGPPTTQPALPLRPPTLRPWHPSLGLGQHPEGRPGRRPVGHPLGAQACASILIGPRRYLAHADSVPPTELATDGVRIVWFDSGTGGHDARLVSSSANDSNVPIPTSDRSPVVFHPKPTC